MVCFCLLTTKLTGFILNNMNKIYKSRSKFYTIWVGILNRVGKHKNYKNIKISNDWKEFENFYNDMYTSFCEHVAKHGEKYTTIERVDRQGNYCLGNCIWATQEIQANNRGNNVYITYNGKTKSCSQWSRELGISRQAFDQRVKRGWSMDRIFNTPKGRGKKFIVQAILDDVYNARYGTKHRLELIVRLEELLKLM